MYISHSSIEIKSTLEYDFKVVRVCFAVKGLVPESTSQVAQDGEDVGSIELQYYG